MLPSKAIFIFGLFMVIILGTFCFIFFFTDLFIERIPRPNRTYMAWVFLIYTAFRAMRLYQQYSVIKRENKH